MIKIVGIRFREGGQIFNFNPLDFQLNIGDAVIVDTQNGLELGFVAFMPRFIPEELLKFPLRDVVRFADDDDLNIRARQEHREAEAVELALELIEKHELEMQLISAQELSYDDKLVFYFTADGRVDFRSLVKDLANVFRKRIELRQIGVRDEARRTGGIGRCGRVLCCASFLKDFGSVSVKMAKNQNLSMNPSKISGVCGRLLCCLKYEDDAYTDARERAPELNAIVNTIYGKGEVKSVDLLKETFVIERSNKDGDLETINLSFDDRLDDFGNKIDFSSSLSSCNCCNNQDSDVNEDSEDKADVGVASSKIKVRDKDNNFSSQKRTSCCGSCNCTKDSDITSINSEDVDNYSSPFDVARQRVNEWIIENAGNSNSSPRYDIESNLVLDSDYSREDKLKNTSLPNKSSQNNTSLNNSNLDCLTKKDEFSSSTQTEKNASKFVESKKNNREKLGRKLYKRKHFSAKTRNRKNSK